MPYYRYNPPLEETLAALAVPRVLAERVRAEPDPAARGRMVNALRRGARTITELDAAASARQLQRAPMYDEDVVALALARRVDPDHVREDVRRWALIELARHRSSSGDAKYKRPLYSTPGYVEVWSANQAMSEDYRAVLADWIRATNPQLASYTFETALAASDRWHEACAAQGSGQEYDGSEVTVHRWPDGWRLVEVRSQNDYEVEGNRMGHCVASHYGSGGLIFSLRDPRNEPHVTIEARHDHARTLPQESLARGRVLADPDARWTIIEIEGKQNKEPIEEYASRLREFFTTRLAEYDADDILWAEDSVLESLLTGSANALGGGPTVGGVNRYGVRLSVDTWRAVAAEFVDGLLHAASLSLRTRSRRSDLDPEAAGRAAYDLDHFLLAQAQAPRGSSLLDQMIERLDEIDESVSDCWEGLPAPREEDYETSEEFARAEGEWREADLTARGEWLCANPYYDALQRALTAYREAERVVRTTGIRPRMEG